MATTDETGQNTNPEPESSTPTPKMPSTVITLPIDSLPDSIQEGDTLKIVSMDGKNVRLELSMPVKTVTSESFGALPIDKMRDFLTQEAAIHAADQTNV
jgi:hypothetical protein